MTEPPRFDHEKLDVYRVAIEFVAWVGELLDGPLAGCRVSAVRHLDEASTSTPLNIAEGNGKRSLRDRSRYFDIAKASALECSACLDVLVARRACEEADTIDGKALLVRIVGMLTRLVESLMGSQSGRVRDGGVGDLEEEKNFEHEHEHEHEHD